MNRGSSETNICYHSPCLSTDCECKTISFVFILVTMLTKIVEVVVESVYVFIGLKSTHLLPPRPRSQASYYICLRYLSHIESCDTVRGAGWAFLDFSQSRRPAHRQTTCPLSVLVPQQPHLTRVHQLLFLLL